MVARFLTQGWVDALNRAAEASTLDDVSLCLSHRIGDVGFVVHIEGGRVRATLGGDVAADITFVEDYATAVALARGELTAQEAATSGRLKVAGDVGLLRHHAEALAELAIVWATVGRTTAY